MSGVTSHPFVKKLRRWSAVLDGNISKRHFCIRQISGQSWLPCRGPPQLGVEAAVVDGFEDQTQEVDERQSDEQSKVISLGLDRVPVTPPGCQQDSSICGNEGMVNDAPASGATLCYIKPAEVPNEPYSGPVQPLPTDAVHEVRPLPPGPQHKNEPQHQEVGSDVTPDDGGKKGKGCDTWGN